MSPKATFLQTLERTLVLSPQMQASIKLLQLGRLELANALEAELLENPFLESDDAPEPEPSAQDLEYDPLLLGERSSRGPEERPQLDIEEEKTLEALLRAQLGLLEIAPRERAILEALILSLNEDGLILESVHELATLLGVGVAEVESCLSLLKSLEPAGVGASSPQESLSLQLHAVGAREKLSGRIIESHYADFLAQDAAKIAASERIDAKSVIAAFSEIKRLSPFPARGLSGKGAEAIVPDVTVLMNGTDIEIVLNDSGLPKLRLSATSLALLRKSSRDASEEKYLSERLDAAKAVLKGIHMRRQTLTRTARSIVKFQARFLCDGHSKLAPLTLRQVANDIGMHESTISRVTANKYIHTPQGTFPFKFFFTSGIATVSGVVSSSVIKQRIKALIANEGFPLSDHEIVDKLTEEGIKIARRTVAKYRDALGIPPCGARKGRSVVASEAKAN